MSFITERLRKLWNRQRQEAVLDAEVSTGYRSGAYKIGGEIKKYIPENIKDYYEAYLNEDKVRSFLDDLVEQAFGTGHYNTVEILTPIKQTSK